MSSKQLGLIGSGLLIFVLLFFFLLKVFSGAWVLPQYIDVRPIQIHVYGLTMAFAVFAGYALAIQRFQWYGINSKLAEKLIFWAIVGGFIGARLYHVASSWQYYAANPIDVLKVWNGGLGIFGAMFGGVIAGVIVWFVSLRANEQIASMGKGNPLTSSQLRVTPSITKAVTKQSTSLRILTLLDWGAPSFVLGQIIGRFGNLFNYEAFGYPTSLPWKMFVPERFRPIESISSAFYHPLFLYEILGNLCILFFLLYLSKQRGAEVKMVKPAGTIFFSYLFLYNTLRFFIEFLRTDSTWIHGVRLNSLTSATLAFIGVVGILFIRNRRLS